MKTCRVCGVEKEDKNFNPRALKCHQCYYQMDKERIKNRVRIHSKTPRGIELRRKRQQRPDVKLYAKEYRARPEVRARRNRQNKERGLIDHKYTINNRIHAGVYQSLRGKKGLIQWSETVGYTIEELKTRLESTFTSGMSWDRISELHVDHIIPLSKFNFNSYADPDFKRAWALDNLQFLWKKDNLTKHAKIDAPFQPSLSFGAAFEGIESSFIEPRKPHGLIPPRLKINLLSRIDLPTHPQNDSEK